MYIVYGLKNCEYCKLAVEELRIRGCSFYYFSMDSDTSPDGSSLNDIKSRYEWPTVPIVLSCSSDGERIVGGYVDLVDHLETKDES
tara:strand:- start:258 stop:515 length:258 start_codon:yes stop_codon:yes gene_type:complete